MMMLIVSECISHLSTKRIWYMPNSNVQTLIEIHHFQNQRLLQTPWFHGDDVSATRVWNLSDTGRTDPNINLNLCPDNNISTMLHSSSTKQYCVSGEPRVSILITHAKISELSWSVGLIWFLELLGSFVSLDAAKLNIDICPSKTNILSQASSQLC